MLRIAEQWYGSDVGRQRQGNEDNFFVRAPLYVVADGMGGAQAGEVASAMAVEAFEPGLPDEAPEAGLAAIIREANARIHEMSRSNAQRSGMGTTCTAAYVDREEVVLAHVGDSRAYLWRNDEIARLTRDHSLVGELVDRGKLTEEQAEMHPQRSVITRALGPEAEVTIDTDRIAARDGDVFLLCSDGLTSMIREDKVVEILRSAGSLEEAGRSLIAAANDAGGRDNITVVLFRVQSFDAPDAGTQETSEAAAVPEGGPPATRAGEGALGGPAAATRPVAEDAPSAPPPARAASAPPPGPAATGDGPRRRRRRPPTGLVVAAVLAVIVLASAFVAIRAVFFVGVDDARSVTVYRGLPYDLPLGIELYSRHYTSGVTIDQVPESRRTAFTDHKLRSLDDATDLVERLETGRLRE